MKTAILPKCNMQALAMQEFLMDKVSSGKALFLTKRGVLSRSTIWEKMESLKQPSSDLASRNLSMMMMTIFPSWCI